MDQEALCNCMKDLTFKRNIMVTPSKLKGVKPWAVFAGNENKMKDTFPHFHISASYFVFRQKAKAEITHWTAAYSQQLRQSWV